MDYKLHSHRYGIHLLENDPNFKEDWFQILNIIKSITDDDIIEEFNKDNNKSISPALNRILKRKFIEHGWKEESAIFQESEYTNKRWRLDFAKNDISLEVGFNHGGTIAWNLIKPTIASELNHVKKEIDTKVGVIITATESLKLQCGFDGAIGEYEKYIRYLKPLSHLLTVPMAIIGLCPPESFYIEHEKVGRRNIGKVRYY